MNKFCCSIITSFLLISGLSAQYVNILGLQPHDLVYSKVTDRLYLTLEQSTQIDSLELVIVNPATTVIEDTMRFPGRPSCLAISNDGQYLFIGSIFPSWVRRINLSTGEALNFTLQGNAAPVQIHPSPTDYKTAAIVEVLPPPTFAYRVAIYDHDVRRPLDIETAETIVFRNNNTLLGIYNSAGNIVTVYNIAANGITQVAVGSVDSYPPNTIMKMVDGRLVMSNGRIYTFNGLYPQHFSWYFNEPFQYGRSFAADVDSGLVYFALDWVQPGSKITLHSYKNNGTVQSVMGIGGLAGSAQNLTDLGGHGRLAFRFAPNTGGLKLVILNPCKSNVPTPEITPSVLGGCDGDTIILSGSVAAAGYFWSNGSNEMTINAMYQNSYTLVVAGPDGCLSSPSAPIQILTHSRPPRCTFVNNSVERICEGGSVTLTAIPPTGWEPIIDHYLWNTGATTQSITVSAGGAYRVSAVTTLDCVGEESWPVEVIVYPVPSQPEIQENANVLYAPFASGYYWFLDGLPLLAETGSTLMLSDTGYYTLQIVSDFGCVSPMSAPFYWSGMVRTYEPKQGTFGITQMLQEKAVAFQIFDSKGALVRRGSLADIGVGTSNLAAGMYFVQWFGEGGWFLGATILLI